MKKVIEQAWRDGIARGVSRATIETNVPFKTLRASPWVRTRLLGENLSWASGPNGAAQLLQVAVRTIRFIEATGVVPSKARTLFPRRWIENPPEGLDHTLTWKDRDGVLFLTTEPYGNPPKDAWDGYANVGLPKGIGMWNPPSTTLFMLAKPEHHDNLVRLRDDLLAFKMPDEPLIQTTSRLTAA